ncbi:MAG: carboxylating nicotinate-nucleotide diphosphorylase [Phycisphaeraceae bacterium]
MAESSVPSLAEFIDGDQLASLIGRARKEDLGPHGLDVTSRMLIRGEPVVEAKMVAREAGVLAGAALLTPIAEAYDERIEVALDAADGQPIKPGQCVARFRGPLASLLSMERVALNFVTHLAGIASLTARYVEKTRGTSAGIYDTRKTLPGLRGLQKYAVACGGGHNHRMGLCDAMLVKDNHIAGVKLDDLPGVLGEAIGRARTTYAGLRFVQVEVDTLEQLEKVLETDVDMILLDNMAPEEMGRAVAMRDEKAPEVELEASGGVNLDTVEAIARAGIDRISVGALTHSAPSLDLGLDIEAQ